jgi:hypothetical protein
MADYADADPPYGPVRAQLALVAGAHSRDPLTHPGYASLVDRANDLPTAASAKDFQRIFTAGGAAILTSLN